MCTALVGCEAFYPGNRTTHQSSSSLVSFLYPNGAEPPHENSIPQLHVPLRVGLAMLPAKSGPAGLAPDAALRQQLLERVRAHFSDRKFVSEITIIPDYYLDAGKGFAGLEALQRLYDLDVVALVSYDQVMHQDENNWSLGYITIVGAYVLKGNRYEISTLVDLAVVDPVTHSLILRAGGVDTGHGNTTLIELSADARASAAAGFQGASGQMIQHLDASLADFEQQVRSGRARVAVVHKSGGGGAFTWPWLLALAPLVLRRAWRAPAAFLSLNVRPGTPRTSLTRKTQEDVRCVTPSRLSSRRRLP
jgi:rhombotail lipoprotein